MSDESFMLVSLKEEQSKSLAQVLSNDSARRLLDFLAGKEFVTESQVAKDLGIPLSTVHYNIKALTDAGLVISDEFHYSEKGKEVPHYRLAKKYIIIAPKDEEKSSVMQRLKRFFPVVGIVAAVSVFIELGSRFFGREASFAANEAVFAAPRAASAGAAKAAPEMLMLTQDAAVNTAENVTMVVEEAARGPLFHSPVALWFLAGAVFALLVAAVWELVRRREKQEK